MLEKMPLKWCVFVVFYMLAWILGPLWVISWATDGMQHTSPGFALGVLVLDLAFLVFLLPRINAWMVHHTPYGRFWRWLCTK